MSHIGCTTELLEWNGTRLKVCLMVGHASHACCGRLMSVSHSSSWVFRDVRHLSDKCDLRSRRASAPADLGEAAEHGAAVRALAFDPTGAWLLSADDTKTVRLWRTADWTVAHTL